MKINSSFLFRSGTWQNPLAMSDSILRENHLPAGWQEPFLQNQATDLGRYGGGGFLGGENQSPILDAGGLLSIGVEVGRGVLKPDN